MSEADTQQDRINRLARDLAAAYNLTEDEAARRIQAAMRDLEKAPEHIRAIVASLKDAVDSGAAE